MPSRSLRLLISGYYGFGNLGDEALLSVIVTQLKTRYPYCEIEVLSAKPEQTAGELRVTATHRWDTKAVRASVGRTDMLISGGGGLLQNVTSLRSLVYYAGIIRAATRAQRKAMIFAQSIGPLDFWGKTVVKECCKNLSAATVRDRRSFDVLEPLLPRSTLIERTADPVFLYEAPEEGVDLSAEGLGPQSDPLVVFSVRKAAGMKDRLDVLAYAADRFAQAFGARVAFLPLGGTADAELSTLVIRKCKTAPMLLPESSLARTANIIRRSRAIVGMRLHALILAARYGVPFLAVPYDPKVSALCTDLEYPLPALFSLAPSSRKPDPAYVNGLVDRVWSEHERLREQLIASSGRLRALAERNFEVLDRVIRNGNA